jgi:hypothetical protein
MPEIQKTEATKPVLVKNVSELQAFLSGPAVKAQLLEAVK